MLAPLTLGSSGGTHWGGASGVGGGAIRIVVADTAALDGWITANGGSAVGHSGGGAGGSIWLTAGALSGQGGFRADGGAYAPGYAGGGGGGGRIAVWTEDRSGFSDCTASTANGGAGSWFNGATGTVVFADAATGDLDVYQNAVIDSTDASFSIVTLHEGASLAVVSNSTFSALTLNVCSGAVLAVGGGSTVQVARTFSVLSNATVWCQSTDNARRTRRVCGSVEARRFWRAT
jgi:hypothetical protein